MKRMRSPAPAAAALRIARASMSGQKSAATIGHAARGRPIMRSPGRRCRCTGRGSARPRRGAGGTSRVVRRRQRRSMFRLSAWFKKIVPRGDLPEHPADAGFALVEQFRRNHGNPEIKVAIGPSIYNLNRCLAPPITYGGCIVLESNKYLIKEKVKILSAVQSYDIFDGDHGELVGTARNRSAPSPSCSAGSSASSSSPPGSSPRKAGRFAGLFASPRLVPVPVPRRGARFPGPSRRLLQEQVLHDQRRLPRLRQGRQTLCRGEGETVRRELPISVTGWPGGDGEGGQEVCAAGLLKELFTSADTFGVEVSEDLAEEPMAKMLILAATLAIDLIYKSELRGGSGITDLLES